MIAWGVLLCIVGLIAMAYAWHAGSQLGFWGGLMVICIGVLCFVSAHTDALERECIARGGQVSHYGRYGEGVDCMDVPK